MNDAVRHPTTAVATRLQEHFLCAARLHGRQAVVSRMLTALHAIRLLDCSLVNCNFTLHLKYS